MLLKLNNYKNSTGRKDFENEFADEYYVQLGFNWYNGTNIQVRYGAQ